MKYVSWQKPLVKQSPQKTESPKSDETKKAETIVEKGAEVISNAIEKIKKRK